MCCEAPLRLCVNDYFGLKCQDTEVFLFQLLRERKAQEEEYMTRLPPIKKLKQLTQLRGISDVDRMVGALRALQGERSSKKKRARGAFSRHSKGKKFSRRFKKR